MICPDWSRLTGWREGDGPAPPGWRPALDHLAACADCRRRVAELDPTLLLCAAPAPEIEPAELAAVRTTVRALRRSERLEGHRRPARGGRRALIAAAAVALVLSAPVAVRRLGDETPAGPVMATPVPAALPTSAGVPPMIEEVLPAQARIYEFGSEDLPVVLIVDETLDL